MIHFHYRRDAFRGAGVKPTRAHRNCKTSPFPLFHKISTLKIKETKVKHKLIVNALPLFYYNFLYQASRHEYENKR